MIELDEELKSVADTVNRTYENMYPQFPQFPKFSFARAMATIWKLRVYDKVKEVLNIALIELLEQEREKLTAEGKGILIHENQKKLEPFSDMEDLLTHQIVPDLISR